MKKKKTENKKATVQTSKAGRENSVKRDPWGCMAGTITIHPGVDLTAPNESWTANADQMVKQP